MGVSERVKDPYGGWSDSIVIGWQGVVEMLGLEVSYFYENYDPIFEKLDFKDGYSSW